MLLESVPKSIRLWLVKRCLNSGNIRQLFCHLYESWSTSLDHSTVIAVQMCAVGLFLIRQWVVTTRIHNSPFRTQLFLRVGSGYCQPNSGPQPFFPDPISPESWISFFPVGPDPKLDYIMNSANTVFFGFGSGFSWGSDPDFYLGWDLEPSIWTRIRNSVFRSQDYSGLCLPNSYYS